MENFGRRCGGKLTMFGLLLWWMEKFEGKRSWKELNFSAVGLGDGGPLSRLAYDASLPDDSSIF